MKTIGFKVSREIGLYFFWVNQLCIFTVKAKKQTNISFDCACIWLYCLDVHLKQKNNLVFLIIWGLQPQTKIFLAVNSSDSLVLETKLK